MSEPNIITYNNASTKTSPSIKSKKSRKAIIYGVLGFLLSMSAPYGNVTPFGLVFLTLERSFKKSTIISFAAVVLGSLMLGNHVLSAKYIAAEIIYFAVLFVLEKGVKISFPVSLLCALVSLFISGAIVIYWQGITLYSAGALFLELVLTAGGIFVFNQVREFLSLQNNDVKDLNTGKRICLCIVCALLLLSFKRLYIGSSISVINVLAAAVIMCIGLANSAPVTAASGVIIGMLCGIDTDYFLPLTGAFGFCGFLTGLFSRFQKGGAAVGLILANAVLTVYTNNAIEPMLKIYEILLAIVILIFIPERVIQSTKIVVELNNSEKEGILKLKESIKAKLKSVSESFSSMARTIENLSLNNENDGVSDISTMFDNAADKVCKKCKKSPVCWSKNFNKTYRDMFSLFEIMEKKGSIEFDDINGSIKDNCINIGRLLEELSVQYDTYRLKKIWKGRLDENRELAGQQLIGMSKILNEIAGDIDKKVDINSEMLRRELEAKGYKPKSTDVFEDKNGKIRISFILKKSSLKNGGEESLLHCLKNICRRDIQVTFFKMNKTGYVRVKAFETEKYLVEKGYASASASDSSGDNFKFYKLSCGKYVITLSDGMGTGKDAAKESNAVIELMDNFLRAGFDIKIAVKLINSVLLMKSENQSFATIDMCIIDLYTGEVEFIKTGAEPSYIKQDEGVLSVAGSSLPIGITAKAEPEVISCSLSEGDTIIMATDGIQTKDGGDNWLKEFIEKNSSSEGAENFAKRLLEKAEEINNGVKDDMTVISVKLHKKAS